MCTEPACWKIWNAAERNEKPKQMERHTILMDWKTQHKKTLNSPQTHLWEFCKHNQAYSEIYMERHKS